MTDLSVFIYKNLAWLYIFQLSISAIFLCVQFTIFGNLFSSTFDSFCLNLTQFPSSSSPNWYFLRFYSSSHFLTFSLLLILVAFRNLNIGPIIFLIVSSFASHFLSVYPWQLILSLKRIFISLCLFFLYYQHLIYRLSIVYFVLLHHQNWVISIAPIFAK